MKSEGADTKLQAAMNRLLAGTPIHTNGELRKENLYKEAQVCRATMNRHKDILRRWDQSVRQHVECRSPQASQRVSVLEERVAELTAELTKARLRLKTSEERVRASATVISALHGENVLLNDELAAIRRGALKGMPSRR